MPAIDVEARSRCRVALEEACAWIDRQPAEHRNPGPGEAQVEVLERTADVCVYRVTRGKLAQTTRRVRLAPNSWRSDRTAEAPRFGRFQIVQTMTVISEGAGSTVVETTAALPQDPRGRRTARIARLGRKWIERGSTRGLGALVLEMEADNGFIVDPSAVFGPSTAAQRWWSRRIGVHSQYSPQHDWAGAGVMLAGVVGSGIGAFVLVEEGLRAGPSDPLVVAALITGAFLLIVGVAFSLAFLFDRWRSIEGVETSPSGVSFRPRRGAAIEVPWPDLGTWGMRPRGDQYAVAFRHARFGADNQLWLTRDHARAILASPYSSPSRPPSFVLQALGLGPSVAPLPTGPKG